MASYEELMLDWNSLFQDVTEWKNPDLQLAAELGKTLLERNKELETTLKHHQNVIDDQAQKIEYLQKQTAALREVNDSRLRIYEQLEVGIQDLERANHRLVVENSNDKKQIKSLSHNIETLEARCEDLNRNLDEARRVLGVERRKNEQLQQEHSTHKEQTLRPSIQNGCDDIVEPNYETYQPNHSMENNSFFMTTSSSSRNANSTELTENCNDLFDSHNITNDENEGLIRLMSELEESKKALVSEQQRVAELEDQLVAIIQENQTLQSRIVQTTINEEMKSIHDELSTLDEVRQGTMCSRCLRSTDDPTPGDEASSIAPTEEDDDQSFLDLVDNSNANQIYRSAVTIKAECVICSKSTKYLHELPISLENLLLELWLQSKKFSIIRWMMKLLQWPALVIYRIISLPQDDSFSFL